MLEFEENIKKLQNLNQKVIELGESLWHRNIGKKVKTIRKSNTPRKLLEW